MNRSESAEARRERAVVGIVVLLTVLAAAGLVVVAVYTAPSSAGPPAKITAQLDPVGWVGPFPAHFWAVSSHTAEPTGLISDPTVQTLLNASPIRFLRDGGGADLCDPITNTAYAANGSISGGCDYDVAALKAFCTSTAPTCSSILQLPGENNNSAEDAAIADWEVHTVGFQPTYFAIGNEPSLWTDYGIPWTSWNASDNSTPTPIAYALDVRNAIAAVRAVDPGARFVGIEAATPHAASWFTTLMEVDGPNLSAIAYHLYPSGAGTNEPTASQLYAELKGGSNISVTYDLVRQSVQSACACAGPQIQIGEYNAGPVEAQAGIYPPLDAQYPNAVFIAASIDQALEAGVPVLTFFDLQSGISSFDFGMLNSMNELSPVAQLYETVLHDFAGAAVENLTVAGSPNTWAAALVTNHTTGRQVSVLISNPQVATEVVLNVSRLFGPGTEATTISWSPSTAGPTTTYDARIGPNVTLPPQGILLINATLPLANGTGPSPAGGSIGLAPATPDRQVTSPFLPVVAARVEGRCPRPPRVRALRARRAPEALPGRGARCAARAVRSGGPG